MGVCCVIAGAGLIAMKTKKTMMQSTTTRIRYPIDFMFALLSMVVRHRRALGVRSAPFALHSIVRDCPKDECHNRNGEHYAGHDQPDSVGRSRSFDPFSCLLILGLASGHDFNCALLGLWRQGLIDVLHVERGYLARPSYSLRCSNTEVDEPPCPDNG